MSLTLSAGRVGPTGGACETPPAESSQVASEPLEAGETARYTTLREPGTFWLALSLPDATATGCADHEGQETEYVFVIRETVEFLERGVGVNGPF